MCSLNSLELGDDLYFSSGIAIGMVLLGCLESAYAQATSAGRIHQGFETASLYPRHLPWVEDLNQHNSRI
jgi:hypothetical protein